MADDDAEKMRRERRLAYRHSCGWSCSASMRFMLRDLSIGGASLEAPLYMPAGMRINLCVLENDPELKSVSAVVLDCERRDSAFVVHAQFEGRTLNLDKALHKYLLRLQTRRVVRT